MLRMAELQNQGSEVHCKVQMLEVGAGLLLLCWVVCVCVCVCGNGTGRFTTRKFVISYNP